MKRMFLLLILFLVYGCSEKYTEEQIKYINEIEKLRESKDNEFKSSPTSPFNFKTKVEFSPLKYFDIKPELVFRSKLTEYETKDTIIIYGTKGEERKAVRFGWISFHYKNKEYKVNVYEGRSKSGATFHSIWFTDKTTGEETYGVGRYIDFELNGNKDYIYTIDFNLAYNPYCAYSSEYSCAIPSKEDFIDLEIEAGEKSFH